MFLLKYSIFITKYTYQTVCFKNLQKPRNDVENKVTVARYKVQQEHSEYYIEVYACNFSIKNYWFFIHSIIHIQHFFFLCWVLVIQICERRAHN